MSPRITQLAIAVAVLLLATAPLYVAPFTVTLLDYIGIYALVALGIVLLTGIGGMVSFGQSAFMGVAAYSTAWATALMGFSPWLGLLLALVLTGALAAVLGAVTLRLNGHFLSLSTIAWGLAIYFTFGNVEGLGNFNGITNVPPITIGATPLLGSDQIYFLIWGILLVALLLAHNLLGSRIGRAMRSLRGGKAMVESLGVDAFRVKLVTFVIAALLATLAGWLYAHMSRFVSPAPFDVTKGIEFLMMAMVGGSGHLLGAVVGAALITVLKNAVQDYLPLIAPASAGQLEIVAFSLLFILFLQYARDGIVPFVAGLLPEPKRRLPETAEPLARRAQPARGTPLLSAEACTRRFGGLIAVNDVSFELKSGEILGLIGPNGAGKSTMFNLLTGALPVSEGRITFAGADITRTAQRRIARAGIARTFQHVKLRPKMSLIDNVLLGTHTRTHSGFLSGALRLDRAEERRARHEALVQLRRVGLGDQPYELAGNLPLGNQRILEIARALAADPILLVLDEPAAGLRRQEKLALAELLRALRTEGLTILIVEHDMEFVMNLVDRIVVMEFGSKLVQGDPASVRADARVQEAYLGGVA
ncbi:branched-chain amino acid ABC transporter ATP-binding protein/permease [Mangrovibrevibacter kandeliae]|uniref:branched-chain amino acid ABC transporter ATP-binding protein/permease n=1 Tax=Mangrovibrevibacter kandeliae TaxID=2968473 RepID=UPI002119675F|nr:branched-chain amino acid ABC transporter ATP-binding protein/permease [Aurantimonas sp. CSK15Z-1]MCQ8782126.1 branched-chain amino acid ABC transporter ATP-binding protein/permease [Aurantimonas sp. CSK15Z-1]